MIFSVPKINPGSFEWIQNLRKIYDPRGYDFIEPHFTFYTQEISHQEYFKQKLRHYLKHFGKFRFLIKKAIAVPPSVNHPSWYTFLVPEYGFLKFCEIYSYIICSMFARKYYSLFFLPHITIGSFRKKSQCLHLTNQLNHSRIHITGFIQDISLARVSHHHLIVLDKLELREDSYAFIPSRY
ncbi:MAG TPA: hypothetical protein VHM20_05295 [Gammaproteobacteria bacterium]|jgi:hypothetical protein|nr:hypothetical protein [Gammaproteobacteria bacterium]